MSKYKHKEIEAKWQEKWEKGDLYKADDNSKLEKKYILDMFPYPSGAGLHVGHVEGYTATDIYSRYLRMQGKYNVLHPMGWDAFGLPAENYAIKTGTHPDKSTHDNIKIFTRQLKALGFSYDWRRELDSSSPEYYKWTQWFFLLLYKNGLAYKKKAKVNWCNSCQTVLANEQAESGKCERCENEVIQKDLEQWFFKITDFIEDQEYEGRKIKGLLSALDDMDWPESTKAAQKNWIGKSIGAEVDFIINNEKVTVFTTRPDTLFGATYFVLSAEHPLVENLQLQIENWNEVEKYIEKAKSKTELERTDLAKEKTGVELKGIKAVNPVNNEEIPVYIADYVMMSYGTGAIMAVPAHDERDWEFAKKYNVDIRQVVEQTIVGASSPGSRVPPIRRASKPGMTKHAEVFTGDGKSINSGFLDGLETPEAKEKMIGWLEEKGLGKRAVNYKMRDWLVSRQRYWGAPIPIVYCEKCGEMPTDEKDLPIELPTDVDFKPTGESPLNYSKTFHDVKCPKCGEPARRESDTMDTFVCSSWYYLRFADPNNDKVFADKKLLKKWLPVDVYVGGAEHVVLHLLYSRFFTKALEKYGYVDFNEPFTKLRHQGIILAEDGTKMSKSKGNVINPDLVIKEFGADSLRMYEMFMGPLEDTKPWNTKGIVGIRRFLDRVWRVKLKIKDKNSKTQIKNEKIVGLLHKTIKKVTEDIEAFKFNTAIAQMMIYINELDKGKEINREDFEKFVLILSPYAPHLAEELWHELGHKESVFTETWPFYDTKLAKDETIQLVLQINGRVRDSIEVAADIKEEEAKKLARKSEKIKKWTDGKRVVKEIFVKGKLVNIVVK